MSQLFDKTIGALNTSLDMRLLRNNITSSNIANAETPNYKAKKLDFENELARALDLDGTGKMETDAPQHYNNGASPISRVEADVYDNPEGVTNNDGNNVDMEREMSTLAENTVMYKAAVELINKKLAAMRYAVTEGTR